MPWQYQIYHFSCPPLRLSLSATHCFLLHLSFYFKLSGRNCLLLSSFTIRLQWISRHSFLPGNDAADELAGWGVHLCFLQSLVVSFLLYPLLCFLRLETVFTEELALPRHACCVFPRLHCDGHSLLLSSYLSRIGRIENPSCSACSNLTKNLSHLILHCPATDSSCHMLLCDCLSLYDLWYRLGEFPGFWGSMVFRHANLSKEVK